MWKFGNNTDHYEQITRDSTNCRLRDEGNCAGCDVLDYRLGDIGGLPAILYVADEAGAIGGGVDIHFQFLEYSIRIDANVQFFADA